MALVCEICGGSIIKKDGAFECQVCGVKYSVEEAKALMLGGTPVSAPANDTTPADNSNRIKNMMDNAKSSYDAGSYSAAFNQYNEVLNLDPNNVMALLYKGLSAGMQSSVATPRLSEAVSYARKAIDCLVANYNEDPEAQKIVISITATIILTEIEKLDCLFQTMYGDYYTERIKGYDGRFALLGERVKRLTNYRFDYSQSFIVEQKNEIQSEFNKLQAEVRELQKEMNEKCSECISVTGTVMLRFLKFVNIIDDVSDDPFGTIVTVIKRWAQNYAKKDYVISTGNRDCATVESACKSYIDRVLFQKKEAEQKKKEAEQKKKEAEQKKKVNAYWETHKQEKTQLNNEKSKIERELARTSQNLKDVGQEISQIRRKKRNEIDSIASANNEKKRNLQNEIDSLRMNMNKLGVFKKKEKLAIQAQIDKKSTQVEELEADTHKKEEQAVGKYFAQERKLLKKSDELNALIKQKKNRLEEINAQLLNGGL